MVQRLQFLFFTSKPCPAPSAQSVVLWSLDVVCVCVCVWAPCLFNCGWGTEMGVAKKWSNVFTCIMFRLKESLLFVWTGLHHVIGNVSQITVDCHGIFKNVVGAGSRNSLETKVHFEYQKQNWAGWVVNTHLFHISLNIIVTMSTMSVVLKLNEWLSIQVELHVLCGWSWNWWQTKDRLSFPSVDTLHHAFKHVHNPNYISGI